MKCTELTISNKLYRADIDGLRAVAVISVILFHLEIGFFSGGFVGVDVFFVISGFLITRLIKNDIQLGEPFKFGAFYLRRARRLLPTLFFILYLSFVLAFILFSPQYFDQFLDSLLYSILSLSNVYFWSESGYFNTASDFKPLLHMWSLSVEEQFYFVWPLFIVAVLNRNKRFFLPFILFFIGSISLYLNFIFENGTPELLSQYLPDVGVLFEDGAVSLFFLTPFRVFEFSIGAITVWLISFQPKNKFLLELSYLIGLCLVFYSILFFTKDTIFPSSNALVPCFGAALIIYSGREGGHNRKLLTNYLSVRIGLISYSLYLIHWPLIVFVKYWKIEDWNIADKIVIFISSFVIATLMYKYIEQPFRKNDNVQLVSNLQIKVIVSLLVFIFLIPSIIIWTNQGWIWRLNEERANQLDFELDHFHKYVWVRHFELQKGFANNGKAKVLVIGDSMAADFVNVLAESGNDKDLDLATIPVLDGCPPIFPVSHEYFEKNNVKKLDSCIKQHNKLIDNSLTAQADTVVLATPWNGWNIEFIDSTVLYLKAQGVKNVFIIARKDQSIDGVKIISRYVFVNAEHEIRTPISKIAEEMNNNIGLLDSSFQLVNLTDYFCNEVGCLRVTDEGHLIIYDRTHFTPEGAKYVGLQVSNSSWYVLLKNTFK